MLDGLLWLPALGVFAVLLLFAVRRVIFTLTLRHPQPPLPAAGRLPTVLLLVPVHNEAASLPHLFGALDRLDYPRDRVRVVLIDDGSTDASATLLAGAVAQRPDWQLLRLPRNVGKAQALNEALAAHDFGEVIYIFDADHRPWSDCLRVAVTAFSDPQIAAVSGRTLISNPYSSAAPFYATVEAFVHQLITMRGKDVLRLGPALLGSNNGYRRSALAAVGGFRRGAFLEDSDLTVALHRAGYTTRFVLQAISLHRAPASIRGYIDQHLRWGRGFNDVARTHAGALLADVRLADVRLADVRLADVRLPLPMRLELFLFSLGYLDRLALLAALLLWVIAPATRLLMLLGIALGVGLPLIQIMAAFAYDRAPRAMWQRLPIVPLFFALDAAVAVWAALLSVLNRPRVWGRTERG